MSRPNEEPTPESSSGQSRGLAHGVHRALSGNWLVGGHRQTARHPGPHPPPAQAPPPDPPLSEWSTPRVKDSGWCSEDFMFGAAMVVFQEDTHKVVVVHDRKKNQWFFPRGRKDVGESLEAAALREGYEESGYRVEFMPHWGLYRSPDTRPAGVAYQAPTCEPIFVTTTYWPPRYRSNGERVRSEGGEYIITWYLGRISKNAERETGTGMPDEMNYDGHLLPYEEARKLLPRAEVRVLDYAWQVYFLTVKTNKKIKEEAEGPALQVQQRSGSVDACGAGQADEQPRRDFPSAALPAQPSSSR